MAAPDNTQKIKQGESAQFFDGTNVTANLVFTGKDKTGTAQNIFEGLYDKPTAITNRILPLTNKMQNHANAGNIYTLDGKLIGSSKDSDIARKRMNPNGIYVIRNLDGTVSKYLKSR
jgi:hypothetical protein